MSTQTQPAPVLAWHRKASKAITDLYYEGGLVVPHDIIAAHDPHATTVRLLEDVAAVIAERTEGHTVVYSDRLRPLLPRIRAHLAALQQEGAAK